MEYLRRSTRPPVKGDKPRTRRNPLDRERDALLVAIGFIGGFRLPSEALGLTKEDVKPGRLFMEGRSSAGEYAAGSKTGPPRDLPLLALLAVEFERVELAYAETGSPLGPRDFWICTRDRELWSASQAENWRERDFRPVARQVANDFPKFSQLAEATPYWTRHTFISSCLQAGLSLATIAEWCGTSIQMISQTYGRMIRRYEGSPPVPLNEQLQTAKLEAMSLSSALPVSARTTEGGSTDGSTQGYLAA
jgi:integrase